MTALDRDISRLGTLADHPAVTARAIDLETDPPWRPETDSFDTIIVTNYLWRPLLGNLIAALKPGGVLIYETFALGNEAYGKPSNPDFLLRPGQLLDAVQPTLSVVAYEHGLIESPQRAVHSENLCHPRSRADTDFVTSGEAELAVELSTGIQREQVIAAADMLVIDENLRHRMRTHWPVPSFPDAWMSQS